MDALERPTYVGSRLVADLSLEDFQHQAALHVEALNYAVRDIDPEKVRVHVCWGAGEGPHYHDPELKDIIGILLRAKPIGISIVSAAKISSPGSIVDSVRASARRSRPSLRRSPGRSWPRSGAP
jgi:hypothetical protein